jgi:hypothetical protein
MSHEKSSKNTKFIDLSHFPVEIEGGRFILRYTASPSTSQHNVSTSDNYSLLFKDKDGTEHYVPMVQSFKFEVNVKDRIPKFNVEFIDFAENKICQQ